MKQIIYLPKDVRAFPRFSDMRELDWGELEKVLPVTPYFDLEKAIDSVRDTLNKSDVVKGYVREGLIEILLKDKEEERRPWYGTYTHEDGTNIEQFRLWTGGGTGVQKPHHIKKTPKGTFGVAEVLGNDIKDKSKLMKYFQNTLFKFCHKTKMGDYDIITPETPPESFLEMFAEYKQK